MLYRLLQMMPLSRMIERCSHSKSDYQETFTKDVIDEIDANHEKGNNKYNTTFEIELKLHICVIASRTFLEMHMKYLSEQDPVKHLQKLKNQYLSSFIDLYRERDQCEKKVQNFTQLCFIPAVTEYIDQSIGPDIVDAVLENKSTAYSSRSLFQYTIQKELLEKSNFKEFTVYILHYKNYVKDWIYNHIVGCFSKDLSLQKLKMKKLEIIIKKITEAVETCKLEASGSPLSNDAKSTTKLIRKLCKTMRDVIAIPMTTVDNVLFQNTSCCDPFTKSLCECIDDLKQQISKEISESTDIKETLENVSVKPKDDLYI
ncbi:uncharacterized protein LOC125146034 [Tachysurus fulvidraco]|uniref:uncharacterized protein LOC125146034 n=1 Tax=Tachysurus fulvidraco TaxID=1234273 RepID=UPI001FEF0F1A|nr:uncharacterized protein LOC125146034 [Tachysurus fulvidraco]